MIEFGFESSKWLATSIVGMADPRYLRVAVIELMNAAWNSGNACIPVDEVFDRLVQVATTGKYTPSEIASDIVDQALHQANQMLSGDEEKLVEEFENDIKKIENMTDDEIRDWLNGEEKDGGTDG